VFPQFWPLVVYTFRRCVDVSVLALSSSSAIKFDDDLRGHVPYISRVCIASDVIDAYRSAVYRRRHRRLLRSTRFDWRSEPTVEVNKIISSAASLLRLVSVRYRMLCKICHAVHKTLQQLPQRQTCCIRGVSFSFKVTDNPNKERPIFQVRMRTTSVDCNF